MRNTNTVLKICLLISLATLATACAPQPADNDVDLSSRAIAPTTTQASTYTNCNQAQSTKASMGLKIRSVYENGKVRSDLMQVKFNTMNSAFSSGTDFIQMWRWQASQNVQPYLDPTPVNFRAETLAGVPLTGWVTSLRWSDLTYAINSYGTADATELLGKIQFTVNIRDVTAQFDVLKVVYYNSNSQAVDQLDALMPLFSILPSQYAIEPNGGARPLILQNLHPLKALAAQGWTTSQLTDQAKSFCF